VLCAASDGPASAGRDAARAPRGAVRQRRRSLRRRRCRTGWTANDRCNGQWARAPPLKDRALAPGLGDVVLQHLQAAHMIVGLGGRHTPFCRQSAPIPFSLRQTEIRRAAGPGDLVGQEEPGNALHANEIRVTSGTCQSCLRLLASCKVHAILAANARTGPANTRAQMPALLKGLIFGPSGAAMLPTATRKGQPTLPLLREPGCVEARTGSVPGPAAASAPARSSRCWP
jgi:hypothetical protein